ncbi:MAG TPA: 3-dehydroquinate synthase [Terriglobales bacterium]|nr:3-dehydroquinate synthase [Terriglobales bacterium]
MITLTVGVQPRPYEARIEHGLLTKAGPALREVLGTGRHLFVATVAPVRRKWARTLMASLASAGFEARLLEMPDGERHKRLATVEILAEKLVALGADRDAVLLAFGGGVTGDAVGLLASLFMRGVEVVQVPTTLLAQVDSSIGGKTGVNLKAGKNLLGTYYQPRLVLIDPAVLLTLPERHYRAGLYEVLKCGVIGNPGLFREFEEKRDRILGRDLATLERLIAESVRLKAAVVAGDERENGLRRVLNLGHTVGHALEAETGYRTLLHGEAVGWGIVAAAQIAAAVGMLDQTSARRIGEVTLALGRLPRLEVRSRSVIRRLRSDKKTRNRRVHFVLPTEIGNVEVVDDVPEEVALRVVEQIRRRSGRS